MSDIIDFISKTTAEIIDELGGIQARIKELKAIEGQYKEALKARICPGQEVVTGRYRAKMTTQYRNTLDYQRVRQEMGEEWWEEHCVEKEVHILTIKPVEE